MEGSHEQSHGTESKKRVWVSLATGIIVLVVLLLYMVTFTVRQGDYGVLKTFGRISWTTEKPGLYWKLPLAQRAVIYDARLKISEDGMLEEIFTKDGKPVIVMTFFTWRIENVERFDTSFGGVVEDAERRLQERVRSKKNAVFGQMTFSDFITIHGDVVEEADRARFERIERRILDEVKEEALKDYGVEITEVGIRRLLLPQAVSEKVFERMRSERQALSKEYLSEGEGEAARIRSQAERDRELILDTARARAKTIRAEGEREAAKYYGVFAKDPELHEFLKGIEALQILANKTTLIIDTSTPPFDLLGRKAESILRGESQEPETE